jgi:hypothetical protein
MRSARTSLLFACGMALAMLAGCREQEAIRHYQAAKPDTSQDAKANKVRLLAAIVPQPDRTWFFKLTGPIPEVQEHEAEFRQFMDSVRFTKNPEQPVTWTMPQGWRHEPGKGFRYATFLIGPKEQAMELSVTSFEGQAGSVPANINRWRGQIGLKPIGEVALAKVTKPLKVDGVSATLVDMEGPGSTTPAMRP